MPSFDASVRPTWMPSATWRTIVAVASGCDLTRVATICEAIHGNRVMRLSYRGLERIGEPHDLVEMKGRLILNFYQLDGASSSGPLPGWRTLYVEDVDEPELTDRPFSGGRPTSTGRHRQWDAAFLRAAALSTDARS
jgi:hypothetical protein